MGEKVKIPSGVLLLEDHQLRKVFYPVDLVTRGQVDLMGTFGKHEVEKAASRLVQFFVQRGRGWEPFNLEALFDFYKQNKWPINDMFFGLAGLWIDDVGFSFQHREAFPCLYFDSAGCGVTSCFLNKIAKHAKPEVR